MPWRGGESRVVMEHVSSAHYPDACCLLHTTRRLSLPAQPSLIQYTERESARALAACSALPCPVLSCPVCLTSAALISSNLSFKNHNTRVSSNKYTTKNTGWAVRGLALRKGREGEGVKTTTVATVALAPCLLYSSDGIAHAACIRTQSFILHLELADQRVALRHLLLEHVHLVTQRLHVATGLLRLAVASGSSSSRADGAAVGSRHRLLRRAKRDPVLWTCLDGRSRSRHHRRGRYFDSSRRHGTLGFWQRRCPAWLRRGRRDRLCCRRRDLCRRGCSCWGSWRERCTSYNATPIFKADKIGWRTLALQEVVCGERRHRRCSYRGHREG